MSGDEGESEEPNDEDNEVQLGFVEKNTEERFLTREWLPNKIGGKPAWLVPINLPHPSVLVCSSCSLPLWFLMQIYAPLEHRDDTHHRAIFIFCCKTCSTFKAFRTQLPNENPFYSPSMESEGSGSSGEEGEGVEREHGEGEAEANASPTVSTSASSSTSVITPPSTVPSDSAASSPLTGNSDDEDEASYRTHIEIKEGIKCSPLCEVCGILAPSACSKCHVARYCSPTHQKFDWEFHSSECQSLLTGVATTPLPHPKCVGVFPQFELVTECEPAEDTIPDDVARKLHELEMSEGTTYNKGDEDSKAMQDIHRKMKVDKVFVHFQQRVARAPSQVLRYAHFPTGALWVSEKNIPRPQDIPPCQNCGAPRTFEFQILPQLIYFLGVDPQVSSFDWGTAAVFTCSSSCAPGLTASPTSTHSTHPTTTTSTPTPTPHCCSYVEEFIWKQDH
ncbi:programmed cell death protein 2 [Pelomyxa schiedti]|nr:programmed cell death protein 2 [Pelomyxa schiedti]